MARPLRIEFPGAVYHVSSHGEGGSAIFLDKADRQCLLAVLAHGMQRFDAQVLAYCLLEHGFELVIYTAQANLSRLMRHINGVYTQAFNRRHGRTGPVLQGRFKSVLVDRENTLLGACQYVESAAVREGLVRTASSWAWSSYGVHTGASEAPAWLDSDGLLSFVLGREARTPSERRKAAEKYASLLARFDGAAFWTQNLRHQIYLGDEAFVARMRRGKWRGGAAAVRPSVRGRTSVAQWIKDSASREQGLLRAYTEGGLSMTAIGESLGLSVSRVSRLIAKAESH
jgi:REP element-mobilizing transposase RayT